MSKLQLQIFVLIALLALTIRCQDTFSEDYSDYGDYNDNELDFLTDYEDFFTNDYKICYEECKPVNCNDDDCSIEDNIKNTAFYIYTFESDKCTEWLYYASGADPLVKSGLEISGFAVSCYQDYATWITNNLDKWGGDGDGVEDAAFLNCHADCIQSTNQVWDISTQKPQTRGNLCMLECAATNECQPEIQRDGDSLIEDNVLQCYADTNYENWESYYTSENGADFVDCEHWIKMQQYQDDLSKQQINERFLGCVEVIKQKFEDETPQANLLDCFTGCAQADDLSMVLPQSEEHSNHSDDYFSYDSEYSEWEKECEDKFCVYEVNQCQHDCEHVVTSCGKEDSGCFPDDQPYFIFSDKEGCRNYYVQVEKNSDEGKEATQAYLDAYKACAQDFIDQYVQVDGTEELISNLECHKGCAVQEKGAAADKGASSLLAFSTLLSLFLLALL